MSQNERVPASRADRQLLIFTTTIVVIAGVLLAVVLFFATGGGGGTPKARPLFIGLERQLLENIKEMGPQYIANPFGEHGFWLDAEGNRIVAYALALPDTNDCTIKWKAQQDSYVDCNGDEVDTNALDRYKVDPRDRKRSDDRDVYVDLRVVEPAPGTDGGG